MKDKSPILGRMPIYGKDIDCKLARKVALYNERGLSIDNNILKNELIN